MKEVNHNVSTHTNIIKNIFNSCYYTDYLELGVCVGENLVELAQIAEAHQGVDIVDCRMNKITNLLVSSTDDFFTNNTKTFDMIFIDADHSYKAAKRDLINSLKILNDYGTIIMHDTDPMLLEYQSLNLCGDCCKITDDLNKMTDINFVSLPVDNCGIIVIRKKIYRWKNAQ